MIDRIVIKNFKSFRNVDLKLGRMNLFIGTNASGKSNFLEALRVLQGIGNGFTIGEILDGKPKSAITQAWPGIRGGSRYALFTGAEDGDEVTIEISGTLPGIPERNWEYRISFAPAQAELREEVFSVGSEWYMYLGSSKSISWCGARDDRTMEALLRSPAVVPFLATQRPFRECRHLNERIFAVRRMLANTQRVDVSRRMLEGYSEAPQVISLGERGEDFAGLVREICKDKKKKDAYLSWLQELLPEQVSGVGTLSGAVGDCLFMLRENSGEFAAPALSEGTLRFAAMAATFFQPESPNAMIIEEIESSIHPSGLRVLVELVMKLAESDDTQVFATTYSPTVLEWLDHYDNGKTFFCHRHEETGESTIRPLTEVPHFNEVVQNSRIGDLLVEGWLEMAL